MYKIYLLFLILLSNCSTTSAQTGEYYSKIHLAENKVITEKYREAIPLYAAAFHSVPSPFLKDLHNALLCALKDGDIVSAKTFIDEILKFDVDTNFYFKSTSLKELHSSSDLFSYFRSGLKMKVTPHSGNALFFRKLQALDQTIRTTCKEINLDYYSICSDEIKLLDSLNLLTLAKLFQKSGVPAEIDFSSANPSKSPDYYLTVKHNLQWGRNNLDAFLFEAVKSYKLHPQFLADLRDYYNESYLKQSAQYGLGYNIKLGNRLFVFDVPVDLGIAIDKERELLHLEPIHEFNQKVIFQYRHPEFLLIYPNLLATIDIDPETEKILIEKWKDAEVFRN